MLQEWPLKKKKKKERKKEKSLAFNLHDIKSCWRILLVLLKLNFKKNFFSGSDLQHMEVSKLGVSLELQLADYTTATACQIQATSATYTTAHGNARSLTH